MFFLPKCSDERFVLAWKRIKNYTQSTMTDELFKDIEVRAFNSEITKILDFDDIIGSFISSKSQTKLL